MTSSPRRPREPAATRRARVAILAQDLIWADRLARAVEAGGGEAVRARTTAELDRTLVTADLAVIDLTALAYDPIAAVEQAHSSGARVLAVGQHDDVPLRKRALAAGAERVLAYRKLHEDGPAVMASFIGAGARTLDRDAPAGVAAGD